MLQPQPSYHSPHMDELERERLGENLRRRFRVVEGNAGFSDLLHRIDIADATARERVTR